MSDAFDKVKRLSFGGIEFPFTDISIVGAMRTHLHEFIKRPGGEVETLARRAYTITVRSEFLEEFAAYADLYPERLSALISLCEQGFAQDLFIGQMKRSLRVKATDWTRSISAAKRSGESVEFKFMEDSSEQYTTLNLIGASQASLLPKLAVLQIEVQAIGDPPALDKLDKLIAAVNAYVDAKDTALSAAEYQVARVDALLGRCDELSRVPSMNLATSAVANTSLVGLWSIVAQLHTEQLQTARPLAGYITKLPVMSVVDISMDLYDGSSAYATEILRLNDFDDAMFIPFGTHIRYLAAA